MHPANDFGPVADLYDAYAAADFDLTFWIEEARRAGEVLELMAGTGRVSLPMADAGVRVTCVDVSKEMLDQLARKLEGRGLEVELVQQDLRALSLGKEFSLAIIPFNSLAEVVDAGDRGIALRRIAQHLRPGGRLIVTLRNTLPQWREPDGQVRLLGSYAAPGGGRLIVLFSALPSGEPGVIEARQFYESYDAAGTLVGKRLLEIKFAIIGRDQLESEAASAGLEVEAKYGDYDRSDFDASRSPYLIAVFRKAVS